jgi:hypothetical protein
VLREQYVHGPVCKISSQHEQTACYVLLLVHHPVVRVDTVGCPTSSLNNINCGIVGTFLYWSAVTVLNCTVHRLYDSHCVRYTL